MDPRFAEQLKLGEGVKKRWNEIKEKISDLSLEDLEQQLKLLKRDWNTFEKTHGDLVKIKDKYADQSYFKVDYYSHIKEIFNESQTAINKEIVNIKQIQVQASNQSPVQGGTSKNDEKGSVKTKFQWFVEKQKKLMGILGQVLEKCDIEGEEIKSDVFYRDNIKKITDLWNKIDQYQYDILENCDVGTDYDYSEYNNMEVSQFEAKESLQLKLDTKQQSFIGTNHIQLPNIVIPKFDGDYLKWKPFSDLFTEMVHKQPISHCQKLWFLKTNLTGDAERLLKHFTITEENYIAAWKTLQDRYDNKRLLVNTLINKLLLQPSHASETSSASAIKSLHDTTQECLLGLQNLGVPIDNWDPLLLHIFLKKLDKTTHSLYEQSLTQPRNLQQLSDFLAFLETRFQSLEALGNKSKFTSEQRYYNNPRTMTSLTTTILRCTLCKGNHQLYVCKEFRQLSIEGRKTFVRRNKLCFNCLKSGHYDANCTSRGCMKCSKKHHSLLHTNPTKEIQKDKSYEAAITESKHTLSVTTPKQVPPKGYVLLSTARVILALDNGQEIECRAILDSGSQVNLISEKLVKKFGLHPSTKYSMIQGIGNRKQGAKGRVNLVLKSRSINFSTNIEAFVLPHIVSMQPSQRLDTSKWNVPSNINLADAGFCTPGPIDLLIGAEFYHDLMSVGQIKLSDKLPTLQNTKLGWIVSGRVAGVPQIEAVCNVVIEDISFDRTIKRFWEMEEAEGHNFNFTPVEKKCELYFNQTVNREEDGRFKVRLPFADQTSKLGESKDIALRRFFSLENRLLKNDELRLHYTDFMNEYIGLGHMEEVNIKSMQLPNYYIPHHCVLKPSSSTTKLRVVFDASSKTTSNMSLNDILLAGPTIQDDLFSILLRFRMPRFVFTADIQKMYRQVRLHEEDRNFHLIFWRNSPNEPLRTYRLCTVTYGTTSAPYLAVKCLRRLAEESSSKYPLGANAILKDFYVDDCMSGSDNIRTAKFCQEQLVSLLNQGGFKLRKWCANHPQLLHDIPIEDQEIQLDFTKEDEDHVKTLGLIWLPKSDYFRVKVNKSEESRVTKRGVASDIARLFDPLGFMGPVVITAKIFLQELWQLNLHWDAALPAEMHTRWLTFRKNLNNLGNIQIPRHVYSHEIQRTTQLHTFADASEKAFGAAIYIRSTTKDGKVIVRLLCAKSRVAPLKKLSIPRLELCAAKLAAELTNRVKTILNLVNVTSIFWSDSEVVLNWINSPSSNYQTFVANRVASIQETTIPQQWRHVSSKNNPADVLSRGIAPEKLATCVVWFYGPQFLHGNESIWPSPFKATTPCDLEKKRTILLIQNVPPPDYSFLERINHGNSFRKLQRIIGYVLRFLESAKGKVRPVSAVITPTEKENSLQIILKLMQATEFKDLIHQLKKNGVLAKNSPFLSLTPFIDENGILRVGGRLKASDLSYDAKHQMLLPYSHHLTRLLMKELHQENLHIGPQGLLSITKQRFWPIKGRIIAKATVQHCIRCTKAKPKMFSQLMGNLPEHRVQPCRPFVNAGVDFCGPLKIHYRGRGNHPRKGYIAVFCCFSTKAIHLEVVSDLTTDAFIGALRRFVGRRGNCSHLYCDNATNFVGTKNRLEELSESIYSKHAQEKIQTDCSKKSIEFHFIPPRAPHFGGLWEAAVKSAKHLLKRSVDAASLTYEELETLIVEIDSILNSRPLTAMSNNPNDFTALTPGHFLIGEPLTATVDRHAEQFKGSLNSRWNAVTQIKNEFWRRWSVEYLHELQCGTKWKSKCQNVVPDTIVIIRDDNLPIMKWPLGRIIKVYKGDDGLVRVADVRSSTGVSRRPIAKLAPLLGEPNDVLNSPTELVTEEERDQGTKRVREERQVDSVESTTNKGTSKNNSNSKPMSKKRKNSYVSSVLTVLLVCMVFPCSRSDPVKITQFNSQPGIHFDNMGISKIISNEWNLIVYYDLQPYWNDFEALSNGTIILEQLCNKIKQKSNCLPLLDQIRGSIIEFSKDNSLLTPSLASTRVRRGAFNIIGNIANSLFGVLDSQYAEEMYKTINKIQTNEDYIIKLLKNQTSIINSTINIVKRDQELTKRKFDSLDKQMFEFRGQINNLSMLAYQNNLQHLFASWSTHITFTIITLQRSQSSIIDVLTDSHNGKISHLLLSPQQLKNELQKIKLHLPASSRLPADDLVHLYKIMSSEGRITNNYAIFKIKLPLVHEDKFELFHLLPIPVTVNSTRVIIETSIRVLAINLRRDKYFPMTENELSSCKVIEDMMFLCKQLHPIFSTKTETNACEFSLFNNVPTEEKCKLKLSEDGPTWTKLSHANQWMYALSERGVLNTVCNDTAFPVFLEGSGIITIQPGCSVSHELLTIQGYQVYHSKLRTSYTKLKNIKTLILPNHLKFIPNDTVYYKDQHLKINELLKRVSAQNIELPSKVDNHILHHNIVGYISLFFVLVIIIVLAWTVKMLQRLRKINRKPIPPLEEEVVFTVIKD